MCLRILTRWRRLIGSLPMYITTGFLTRAPDAGATVQTVSIPTTARAALRSIKILSKVSVAVGRRCTAEKASFSLAIWCTM